MTYRHLRRFRGHGRKGTTLAEMPVALWLILMMCFAFLILCTETMRFGFFWNACREAAMHAAKCQTFEADSAVGPSACTVADQWAQKATAAFSGLSLTNVNVYILSTTAATAVSTKNPNRKKLATAADTDNCIYDIQVEMSGNVEPLIRFPVSGFLGNVVGLTAPFPVVVRSQYTAEVPQGLNQ